MFFFTCCDRRDAGDVNGEIAADGVVAVSDAAGRHEETCVSYQDGSQYRGVVDAHGRRHGCGRWTSTAGSYEGQWVSDAMHGEGVQCWPDGRTYRGQFKNGRFEGMGRMEWRANDGGLMVYEGQYQDDRKHGEGKFFWADGRVYSGQWRQGRRHGEATYRAVKGDERVGRWKNDKLVGWLDEENRGDDK